MIFVTAHQAAFDRAGILHRDVSDSNVMMSRNSGGPGFIADFDHAFNWKQFLQQRGWRNDLSSWQQFIDLGRGISRDDYPATIGRDLETPSMHEHLRALFKERTVSAMFSPRYTILSDIGRARRTS